MSFWICPLHFPEHPEQTRTEQNFWDLCCSVLQLSNSDFVRFRPNRTNRTNSNLHCSASQLWPSNTRSRSSSLKPSMGAINVVNTNEKQQNVKIDILYALSTKTIPSHFVILPMLSTIKLTSQFPRPPYDGDDRKRVWTVTLPPRSPDYRQKMLLKD